MKYWWKRYQENGNVNRRLRENFHRALNDEEEREIVERMQANPFLTAITLTRKYNVSDPTILSVLKRNGLKCRVAAKQTRLTEEHRFNRMAFCESLLEWDDERLNSILFTDEKTFCTDVRWRSNVFRPANMRYHPDYVKTQRLSGRITGCYWGSICIDGPATDLVKIDGNFNSFKYMNIIRNYVTPAMQNFENPHIFMQDNSPIHTAGRVMNLLSEQPYELMAWPPLSPDLNPIENVWSFVTRDWPQMENRTSEALDELIQRRWNGLRDNPS